MLFYQLTSPGTPLNIRRLLTFLRCIGETMMSMNDFPAAVGSVQKSTPRNGTFYTGDWTGTQDVTQGIEKWAESTALAYSH